MSYCSDLTKERIMECAKAEFLKKGFQAAQLKDIVTAAKVTTGAVYRHFKDKEALFLALIEDVYHYTLDFIMHSLTIKLELEKPLRGILLKRHICRP